ncbi:MAG: glycoside hydrolase family 127 protein, partial [Planctomycetes bacterium]|nr:glycoside hydrolase family 127 protein [Planctomycetota bacterium]
MMRRAPAWGWHSTLLLASVSSTLFAGAAASPRARLRGVDAADVRWTEGFWARKFDLCRREMLASVERGLLDPRNSEGLENLRIAAGLAAGPYRGRDWSDGDCYKWLEALAHTYAVTRDPELDRKMDEWIAVIAKAQAPDGYISTNIQLDPTKGRWQGVGHHALYNMGHLISAACAHRRATGKDSFLEVARRAADCLHEVFGSAPRALARFDFNPSQMMALVDLYRETGERRYLSLADLFVTMRGSSP